MRKKSFPLDFYPFVCSSVLYNQSSPVPFQHFSTFVSIIIFVTYYFTFDLPKWNMSKEKHFYYTTLLAPTHCLFQLRPGKKINCGMNNMHEQYYSTFNLSPITPVREGLNFKEQTITVCGEQRLQLKRLCHGCLVHFANISNDAYLCAMKFNVSTGNSTVCSDIWHEYHERYFETVKRNFTSRLASEILDNFEISPMIFMPNITYKSCYYLFILATTRKRLVISHVGISN